MHNHLFLPTDSCLLHVCSLRPTSSHEVTCSCPQTVDSVNSRRVIRAKPDAKTTGYFIVKLEKSLSHEEFMHTRDEILKDSDGYPVYEADSDLFKVLTVKVKESMLDQVKHIRGVEYIEEETYAHSTEIPWSLDQIDQCSEILDNDYQPDGDGEGVDIYILDTGIRYSHSEFEGRAKYSGRDPVDEYYGTNRMGLDCQGHGTHVASLAAGKKYGAAKKANLYSVRVLDCGGSAPWSVILNGLNHVAELLNDTVQPAIISMSLGGYYITAVDDLVTAIVQANIPVVVAAGNYGEDACDYSPASNSLAVTVGASREGAGMYSNSNGGSCVDIIAPGVDVLGASWLCDTCIRFLTGTSMATPLVSGVAAIQLSFQPLLTPLELKQILFDESCKNILNFNDWFAAFFLKLSTPNRLLHIESGANDSFSIELISATPLPTSALEISVLPFLDLDNDANMLTGVDDSSIQFKFPKPFHFNLDIYTSGHISSNGLISFGRSFTVFSPRFFPINAQVIAPYWDDIDLRNRGSVIFDSFNAQNSPQILKDVSDFINSVEKTPDLFEASSVVVIYWRDTCPYGSNTCFNTNSFQLVLASSDETSFAVFTYKCGSLNWVNHRASIGYSAGEDFFFNHPLSRRSYVNDIACVNQPFTPWSNVVFNFENNATLSFPSDFLLPTPTSTVEEGLCLQRGFRRCCTGTFCFVSGFNVTCFCDEICHQYRDCCSDILEIGCFDPSEEFQTSPSPTEEILSPSPSPTNDEEISILPFLELSNDVDFFTGVDDSSRQFQFPQPFHFNFETFTSGHISSNGLISFGSPFTSFSPRLFPIVQQVIAPYWDDIDLSSRGTIFYDSFNAQNGLKVLKTVSNFINSVQWEPTQFEASSVVIVYWRDTCPFGDSRCSKTNSFQVVLASSSQTSFVIFTYKCGFLNWVRNRASIGYSGGGDFFFNHPLSRRSNVNDIACLNQPITPWSNVVFNSEIGIFLESPSPLPSDLFSFSIFVSDIFETSNTLFSSSTTPTPTNAGGCVGRGFQGCCIPGGGVSCYVSTDRCYCDEICHRLRDCCLDILEIGCFDPSAPEIQSISSDFDLPTATLTDPSEPMLSATSDLFLPSPTPTVENGSCAEDGYQGCCDSGSCFVGNPFDGCYCDQLCHQYHDCCSDILEIGCFDPLEAMQSATSDLFLPSSTPTIEEEISVLPFLALGNDANTFFGVDDSSIQFEFPQTFHFNRETFQFGHISSNGLISFGSSFKEYFPSVFPISFAQVIAPYWDDIDLTNKGRVIFDSFDAQNDSHVLKSVSDFINSVERSPDLFEASAVVVIYWKDVCPYGFSTCSRTNSFQVVLASNEETSFAVFTYKCGSLYWVKHNASIGYSGGEDFFFNHPLSGMDNVNDIACLNHPITPWSNVVLNCKNEIQSSYSLLPIPTSTAKGDSSEIIPTDYLLPTPTPTVGKEGSCVERGFQGCCVFLYCFVDSPSGRCWCDQACHHLRDCCSDILEIGCFDSSETMQLSSSDFVLLTPSPTLGEGSSTTSMKSSSPSPSPTNEESISVLPFLDLGSNADIFTGVDDSSVQFQFPQPFHFNQKIFTSAFISSNGMISFGHSFTEFLSGLFPISAQVIAPYWDDIDLRDQGSINFASFNTQNGSQVLRKVSDFINSVQRPPRTVFEAQSVVVVYWRETCPLRNSTCSHTNSFQVVLASSNQTSFAVFTYKCGLLNWIRNKASIGFSSGEDFFFNHPLSKMPNVNNIACLNQILTPWSNVVFNSKNGITYSNDLTSATPPPRNDTEISILPFLDLGSKANIFTGVDDSSRHFQFPQPFRFNQKIFTSGHISSNGLISFGKSFISHYPRLFPINTQVISPYWDDINLRDRGSILFDSFTVQNGSQVLKNISDFINSDPRSATVFEASSAVIVYWRNTCPFENSTCSNKNSFQVVLASNNQTSFAIYTYKCGMLNWVKNRASIGYSAGKDSFFNHPLSKRLNINDIACLNKQITPWSNVAFNSEKGTMLHLMYSHVMPV